MSIANSLNSFKVAQLVSTIHNADRLTKQLLITFLTKNVVDSITEITKDQIESMCRSFLLSADPIDMLADLAVLKKHHLSLQNRVAMYDAFYKNKTRQLRIVTALAISAAVAAGSSMLFASLYRHSIPADLTSVTTTTPNSTYTSVKNPPG